VWRNRCEKTSADQSMQSYYSVRGTNVLTFVGACFFELFIFPFSKTRDSIPFGVNELGGRGRVLNLDGLKPSLLRLRFRGCIYCIEIIVRICFRFVANKTMKTDYGFSKLDTLSTGVSKHRLCWNYNGFDEFCEAFKYSPCCKW
jgi:hypothetical protein